MRRSRRFCLGMDDRNLIPYNLPAIGQEEIDEVTAVLQSGWVTTGPKTARFEDEFRNYLGAKHALAVNSCTGGLHLALAALGIGPGAEVITTPLTFCSTVNTIIQVGATPVLADVGEDGNVDPDSIALRITERTRAILPVHLGGLPCEMERIWRLASQRGLLVVEDAAHAVGGHYQGSPLGGFNRACDAQSDVVAFSFYATKNMTTGEGGMVTTESGELSARMGRLCLHGISNDAWERYSERGGWYYEVSDCGFKYNMSDIQAAMGIVQLRKLESFIEIRRRYADMYNATFSGMDELELPPNSDGGRHGWHLYAIRLNLDGINIDRAEFIRHLRHKGIGTSVHFIPVPLHPFFRSLAQLPQNQCPRALELYPRLISLPLYPTMTEEQVRYVGDAVKEVARANRRTRIIAARAG